LNPGVLEMVRRAGLVDRLGRERMLFNARAAIERFQSRRAGSTGVPPLAAASNTEATR
jgi:sulfate permease, SulP family